MIGRILDRNQIMERLGEGGMGEAYLAENKNLYEQVAIKALPDEFAQDAEKLAGFEREAHRRQIPSQRQTSQLVRKL